MRRAERSRLHGLDLARGLAVLGLGALAAEQWNLRAGYLWLFVLGVAAARIGDRAGGLRALAVRGLSLIALGLVMGQLWGVEPLLPAGLGLLVAAAGARLPPDARLQVGVVWLLLGGAPAIWGWTPESAVWAVPQWTQPGELRWLVIGAPLALVPWLGLVWLGQWAGAGALADPERSRVIAWVAFGGLLLERLLADQAASAHPTPGWATLLEGTAPLAVAARACEAVFVAAVCVRFGVWLGTPPGWLRPVLAVGRAPVSAWVAQLLVLAALSPTLPGWPGVVVAWVITLLAAWGWRRWRPAGPGPLEGLALRVAG